MGGKKKPGKGRGRGRETQPQQAVPQQQQVQQVPSASGSTPQLAQPPTAGGISEQPQPATAQQQQQMAGARQRTTGVSGETKGDQTTSTKVAPKEPPQHKQQAEESRQGHQPKQVPQKPPGAQAASPMPSPSGERTVSAGDQVKMMEKEMKELMFKTKVEKTPLPKRPERPASCWEKQITVVSNCFEVKIPRGLIYHYDIEVSSRSAKDTKEGEKKKYRALSNKVNRKIVEKMLQGHPVFRGILPVYDGRKNIFTNKSLNFQGTLETSVTLDADDEGNASKTFDVALKFVAIINLETVQQLYSGKRTDSVQDAIMALDVILRHGPMLAFTPIYRSFYLKPDPNDMHPLSEGKEVWFGYHQSLRLGQWKPMLVIDKANTVFRSAMWLIDFIQQYLNVDVRNVRFLRDADIVKITKELKGVIVRVSHQGIPRKYRIVKVLRKTPREAKFRIKTENGAEVETDVMSYFQRQYNYRIQYENLPLLQMHPETKNICMPMEVCEIVEGQHYRKKLSDRDTADMIKYAAVPPEQRFREINRSVNMHHREGKPWLEEFGISINLRPMEVQAHILETPQLLYDTTEKPYNGSWNMKNKKFLNGATVGNWVIICLDQRCYDDVLEKFAKMLCRRANELGMQMPPHSKIIRCRPERGRTMREIIQNLFRNLKQKEQVRLAVVVLERKDVFYREVKQAGDTKVGLITQCALQFNISKKLTPDYVTNILMKINAKMGGQNNTIDPRVTPAVLKKPVIVIGVDVSHPAPSEHSKPSIAAAVASIDSKLCRYAASVKVQQSDGRIQSRVEVIREFKDMVKELLRAFYQNTRCKPEKIIVYRDGVSEGQFTDVRNKEILQIREACLEMQAGYEPGITFIIVQKRHHTRFKPKDRNEGVGRHGNIPPGTTIDTGVIHPIDFDFYLCSHFGIQGTSRPAHYYVVWDDSDFSADELYKLTYHLCHVYARCTRTISAPAPVRYADLVAYHARHHLQGEQEMSSSSGEVPEEQADLSEEIRNAVLIQEDLKKSMYFV